MSTHSLTEKWQQRVQSWRDSGLSQSTWCKQHNLRPNQFWYWRKKFDEASLPVATTTHKEDKPSAFVQAIPVSQAEVASTAPSSLSVTLPSGLTVTGFDQTNLKLAQQLIGLLQ